MSSSRHALYLDDEENSFFQAEAGREVRIDVPLVDVVRGANDLFWLWRDRIPLGLVTLIEGGARSGKSFVAIDLAARLSAGGSWPDSSGPGSSGPDRDGPDPDRPDSPEKVPEGIIPDEPPCLVISRQHTPGDTLGRRLQLAGGDPNCLLHFSQFRSTDSKQREALRAVRFPDDLPAVEHLLEKHKGVRLIVIDPLSDFCRTPALMTESIHQLNELAADHLIAVVATLRATSQFDRRGRLEVKSRWSTDAARCTWFVAGDPDNDSRRLFVPTRTNFCVEPRGLRFAIEAGRVVWDPAASVDAGDPLQNQSGCALWLSHLLSEGEVPAKTVFRLGAECGYTLEMLRYAANQLGVQKLRVGFGEGSHSQWSLNPFRQSLVTVRPVLRSLADHPAFAPAPLLEQGSGFAAAQVEGERVAEAPPDGI